MRPVISYRTAVGQTALLIFFAGWAGPAFGQWAPLDQGEQSTSPEPNRQDRQSPTQFGGVGSVGGGLWGFGSARGGPPQLGAVLAASVGAGTPTFFGLGRLRLGFRSKATDQVKVSSWQLASELALGFNLQAGQQLIYFLLEGGLDLQLTRIRVGLAPAGQISADLDARGQVGGSVGLAYRLGALGTERLAFELSLRRSGNRWDMMLLTKFGWAQGTEQKD